MTSAVAEFSSIGAVAVTTVSVNLSAYMYTVVYSMVCCVVSFCVFQCGIVLSCGMCRAAWHCGVAMQACRRCRPSADQSHSTHRSTDAARHTDTSHMQRHELLASRRVPQLSG